ncbi:19964_t:CDS:2 [Gigaspora margarita]|uniref:19964_t:CDS:1 n=1 Tax=Gigaspora margarita TaxID=4874 RepID=A0ABN7VLV4_GIGMA|nr:19964_t:CDS:2 [Gigaspora margarita]
MSGIEKIDEYLKNTQRTKTISRERIFYHLYYMDGTKYTNKPVLMISFSSIEDFLARLYNDTKSIPNFGNKLIGITIIDNDTPTIIIEVSNDDTGVISTKKLDIQAIAKMMKLANKESIVENYYESLYQIEYLTGHEIVELLIDCINK